MEGSCLAGWWPDGWEPRLSRIATFRAHLVARGLLATSGLRHEHTRPLLYTPPTRTRYANVLLVCHERPRSSTNNSRLSSESCLSRAATSRAEYYVPVEALFDARKLGRFAFSQPSLSGHWLSLSLLRESVVPCCLLLGKKLILVEVDSVAFVQQCFPGEI